VLGTLAGAVHGLVAPAWAGTTGRITGRVVDQAGKPLVGVTILVVGARLGAGSDANGSYSILNVPAGRWDLKANLLGYGAVTVQGVEVSADKTTRQDFKLVESAVQMKEVVVSAERPVVELGKTSSVATVTRNEIASLPVQELQDIVDLQAGVVDGHFRGGRIGEVQYQVDGVSVNNAFNNESSIRIDRSLLEEVQVISGTFDAEYGQAMSGVVNAVLRRGTETWTWNSELFAGQYWYPGREEQRRTDWSFRPASLQNYQADVSGPLPIPHTLFLASARYSTNDSYIDAVRLFNPTDSSDFANKVFTGTGDGKKMPLGYADEWNAIIKLTNRGLGANKELSYQLLYNTVSGKRTNWAFRYNPDGAPVQHTNSVVHGFDWTHTVSKSTFYQFAVRQNYIDYHDWVYEDLYDPRYDDAGPPQGDADFENGAYVQGVEFGRFFQKTNTLALKGSVTTQAGGMHFLKAGGEYQWPWLQFGSPGTLVYTTVNGTEQLVRKVDDPPDYPGIQKYHPMQGAAYAQDEINWSDLTLRAGLRFEYFDARWWVPSDPANPANAIQGAPLSSPQSTTAKTSVAPRLGVSYPITKTSNVFFAYGHFYQMPALGTIFTNSDYQVLANLQAGGVSYGVLGNPDVKPEKTVQYQFGYKQALNPRLGLDLQMFYKDIRDLLGVEFVSTYNNAEYARLTNVDFGSVIGFTVALDQRPIGLFSGTLDYTWQVAQGNSSDPRETATRAEAGQDPRPRQIPFNWDQRHTLNATLRLEKPADFNASTVIRYVSGMPYTPAITTGFGGALESNSGRKPSGILVDLRGEKFLGPKNYGLAIFARVFNLFDARYFNGFVFSTSGSPFYSPYPTTDAAQLADPTLLYGPRRIEFGVRLAGASR
jgi:outer membrane receptor protein involved in Fe transport